MSSRDTCPRRPGTVRRHLVAVLALALASLAGCANRGVPMHEIAPEINESLYLGPTIIQVGDTLEVRFLRLAEWNTTARVRQDGMIALPEIGDRRAAGRTIEELRSLLIEAYAETEEAPSEILITLDPVAAMGGGGGGAGGAVGGGPGVSVAGEVGSPGVVMVSGYRLTLVDGIAQAGSYLKDSALLANTLLIRRSPTTGAQRSWRIDARPHHWGKGDPLYLQPYDLVFVPNTPVDDLNIWIDKYLTQNIPGAAVLPFVFGIAVAP